MTIELPSMHPANLFSTSLVQKCGRACDCISPGRTPPATGTKQQTFHFSYTASSMFNHPHAYFFCQSSEGTNKLLIPWHFLITGHICTFLGLPQCTMIRLVWATAATTLIVGVWDSDCVKAGRCNQLVGTRGLVAYHVLEGFRH